MPDSVFLDRVSRFLWSGPRDEPSRLGAPQACPREEGTGCGRWRSSPRRLALPGKIIWGYHEPCQAAYTDAGICGGRGVGVSWATSHITLTLERLETESVSSGTCSVSMWLSEVMQMTPDTKATFLVGSAPTCCHTSLLGELRGQPEARAWRLPGSRMHPSPLPSLICIVSP